MSTLNGTDVRKGLPIIPRVLRPFEPDRELPPQNLEAERGVIAGLLINNSHFDAVMAILEWTDFYRDAHQLIYRAMCDLHLRQVAVDPITLIDELDGRSWSETTGGLETLTEIAASVPHDANCLYHAGIVKEKAKQRAIIEAMTEGIRRAYAGDSTADKVLGEAVSQLVSLEASKDEEVVHSIHPWPEPMAAEGYYGLAGEIVRAIEPHTESDPAAIFFQLLAGVGNMVGRNPHWRVEASRHHCNLFVAVCGNSSKARKGTSFDYIRHILSRVDPDWAATRQSSGYTSGEGLIADVADDVVTGASITPGIADKRLFWVEGEFAGILTVMSRDGNTLSSVTRQAWDGAILGGRSKHRPLRATGAHISICGHITAIEVNDLMTSTNAANGFGNRFLWVCAKRSKLLPHGGHFHKVDVQGFVTELVKVKEFARLDLADDVPVMRDRAANQLWEEVYPVLSTGRPGLLGAMTSRAEAQTMRLACLFAVLDRDMYIRVPHLKAALACWAYCEQSARFIFGERMGDPEGEKIIRVLHEAGADGLPRTAINRKAFSGHQAPDQLEHHLSKLVHAGLIEPYPEPLQVRGKPVQRWRLRDQLPTTGPEKVSN